MFLKYCGFTRKADVDIAVECGISALGLIFYPKSKRYITPEHAKEITRDVPSSILKIGVFVKESSASVNEVAEKAGLDRVQIFAEDIENRDAYQVPVIPVYRINEEKDFSTIADEGIFLLDAFSLKGAGGTGDCFDWNMLTKCKRINNAIIAGGVDENNLEDLLQITTPYGIDLSSGLEEGPGIKSHEKMKRFRMRVKELTNEQS